MAMWLFGIVPCLRDALSNLAYMRICLTIGLSVSNVACKFCCQNCAGSIMPVSSCRQNHAVKIMPGGIMFVSSCGEDGAGGLTVEHLILKSQR